MARELHDEEVQWIATLSILLENKPKGLTVNVDDYDESYIYITTDKVLNPMYAIEKFKLGDYNE